MFLLGASANFIPYLLFVLLTIILAGNSNKNAVSPISQNSDVLVLSSDKSVALTHLSNIHINALSTTKLTDVVLLHAANNVNKFVLPPIRHTQSPYINHSGFRGPPSQIVSN
jgi:hypothetical protein